MSLFIRLTKKGEKMKKFLKIFAVAMSLLLILSGCSKGNTAKINVTITDYAYSPSTFTVPAGAEVTIKAINNGAVEHEFAIMKKGTSVIPPFGDKDEGNIFWELDGIEAGQTKSATFTAPTEPGEYEVICGLPNHIEQGMHATLTVK
jgi:plastocyanin